jgi:putative ABC transport system ATP-binding protein
MNMFHLKFKSLQKLPVYSHQPTVNRALVELKDIYKIFETTAGQFKALDGINLHITSGEFVAIVGKSGSGKSTLINMITGIDRPTSGQLYVAGTALHGLNEEQLAIWRGRAIGVIFQFFQLLPTITAVENVLLPMDYCNLYPMSERPERAMELLKKVHMETYAHRMPGELSGGQQQTIAIARALANNPPLIVADEPTGNLDSKSTGMVFNLFESLADEGKTVLMVTHDNDLAKRTRRIVTIADGQIVRDWPLNPPLNEMASLIGKEAQYGSIQNN